MNKLAVVAVLCFAVVAGCKKKEDAAPAAGSGSGSAPAMAAGSGSGSAPAMAAGSGSAASAASAGSAGSAVAAAGSGSAGSAMAAGSGSAGSGSAAAPVADAKNWDCKKLCTEAVKCKDKDFKSEKECEGDCTKVMKDTTGKYTNGSIQGVPFYSCANTAKDCAALKKCTPGAK